MRVSLHSWRNEAIYWWCWWSQPHSRPCKENNDQRHNLRYQKCNSRPFTFNADKINADRKPFWAYFVDHLEPSTFIINVDESTFSWTSKINYSWSKAGRCSEVKNAPFSGSTSMILAILSNGLWMCLLTPRTVNS